MRLKYKYIKKSKKKLRKIIKKTKKTRKNKMNGGTIIGSGTHGTIEIDETNPEWVLKKFKKLTINYCDKLQDEFKIQDLLYKELKNEYIYIPNCCCFTETSTSCYYKMERIFPLFDVNLSYYFVINMANDTINKKFSHSKTAFEVGVNKLIEYDVNVSELSFNIGKLFSKLHFELNQDGYDCELLYGIINNTKTFCLIDFDKIAHFEWVLGNKSYRKIDEQTIIEKQLNTISKFAWYLFGAMISMSLVPTNKTYQAEFIKGYSTYVNKDDILKRYVYNEIINIINEYTP